MKTWRLVRRFTGAVNAAQLHRVNVADYDAIVAWAIQGAGGVATANVGFVDSTGVDHPAFYRAALAVPVAEPPVCLGQWSRGSTAFTAPAFGPPPAILYVALTAPGAAITSTVEVWGYRDEDA